MSRLMILISVTVPAHLDTGPFRSFSSDSHFSRSRSLSVMNSLVSRYQPDGLERHVCCLTLIFIASLMFGGAVFPNTASGQDLPSWAEPTSSPNKYEKRNRSSSQPEVGTENSSRRKSPSSPSVDRVPEPEDPVREFPNQVGTNATCSPSDCSQGGTSGCKGDKTCSPNPNSGKCQCSSSNPNNTVPLSPFGQALLAATGGGYAIRRLLRDDEKSA